MFRRLFRLGTHSPKVATWGVWDVMAEYWAKPRTGGAHREGVRCVRIINRLRYERERAARLAFA